MKNNIIFAVCLIIFALLIWLATSLAIECSGEIESGQIHIEREISPSFVDDIFSI